MRRQRNLLGPQGMGGMVSLWGASSLIKSVQAGVITIAAGSVSNTATITAVDLVNSYLVFNGVASNSPSDGQTDQGIFFTKAVLTNATTVTASKNTTDVTYGKEIYWVVVEFVPGVVKSIQRGVITTTGALAADATITSVNTSKAIVVYGGHNTSYPSPSMNTYGSYVSLVNATTVRAGNASSASNYTLAFSVVEYF